jgi:hypothetical protein
MLATVSSPAAVGCPVERNVSMLGLPHGGHQFVARKVLRLAPFLRVLLFVCLYIKAVVVVFRSGRS